MHTSDLSSLGTALMRLAQLRRDALDALQLQAALRQLAPQHPNDTTLLQGLAQQMAWPTPQFHAQPDAGRLPCLVLSCERGTGIVKARNPAGHWVIDWWRPQTRRFEEDVLTSLGAGEQCVRLRMTAPYVVSNSPSLKVIWAAIWRHSRQLFDMAAGTVAISVLALASSFYSMQVYDRVVPTQASATLWVLSLGVVLAIVLELVGKWVRGHQLHALTDAVDQDLARQVYGRFLQIRLDQLPPSVGATASRLRGYESVRGFLVNLSTQAVVDIPLALITLAVLFAIGGPVAWIPAGWLVVGLAVGLHVQRRLEQLAARATPAAHLKSGLLVESIEGAETIKSGQGGWRMLSRWLDITDEARNYEQQMRQLTEQVQYVLAMLQQVSYVGLIATGALLVGHDDFTQGGLIACSILSGRILGPIGMVPQLLMQWSHTRVALQDLDRLWTLERDHPAGVEPVVLQPLRGQFDLLDIDMQYGHTRALRLPQLQIRPGERIALLGNIGSGKTSLLRLLSGMYKPQTGRVLLDGHDLDLIAKSSLCESIGFVAQDGRLFAGTLRDNLLLGLPDPGDEHLMQVARRTGLFDTVIAAHPKGLARDISEGGQGLSGGQRQLVHITRAVLRQPTIWLLDEPTAAMDTPLEHRVLSVLSEELRARPGSTLVLATHKPQLLALVDRLIILSQQQVVLDGPKETVLQQLARQGASS